MEFVFGFAIGGVIMFVAGYLAGYNDHRGHRGP